MKVKPRSTLRFRPRQTSHLLLELVTRDVKARYVGSMLGPAWSVLAPLLWVLIYTFVFSVVLRIPLSGEPSGVAFPEYLLAGFLPWMAVQEGISRSTTCLSDNAAMVKKTAFPRQTLVATVVLAAVVNELIGLALYAVYVGARGHLSARWLLLAVPMLALQIAATIGIGSILAAMQVFFRDTAAIVALGLAMLGFLTPIFYPVSIVPPRFRWVVAANPFAHLIEGFRDVFFRHRLPEAGSLLYLLAFSVLAAAAGSLLFTKAEPQFADLL